MAYEPNTGLPIVDGKPYDAEEAEMDSALEGLKLDGKAMEIALQTRLAVRAVGHEKK